MTSPFKNIAQPFNITPPPILSMRRFFYHFPTAYPSARGSFFIFYASKTPSVCKLFLRQKNVWCATNTLTFFSKEKNMFFLCTASMLWKFLERGEIFFAQNVFFCLSQLSTHVSIHCVPTLIPTIKNSKRLLIFSSTCRATVTP